MLAKLEAYVRDGAGYALAIDPFERRLASRGVAPAGLAIDAMAIADA